MTQISVRPWKRDHSRYLFGLCIAACLAVGLWLFYTSSSTGAEAFEVPVFHYVGYLAKDKHQRALVQVQQALYEVEKDDLLLDHYQVDEITPQKIILHNQGGHSEILLGKNTA